MAKLTKKAAAQLREHLAGQEHERLVELLMAEAPTTLNKAGPCSRLCRNLEQGGEAGDRRAP